MLYKGQETFLESFFLVVFKIFGPKNLDLDPYQDSVPMDLKHRDPEIRVWTTLSHRRCPYYYFNVSFAFLSQGYK